MGNKNNRKILNMSKYQTCFIEKSTIEIINNTNHKAHIAIIAGGMSSEREISLISSKNVIKALLNLQYKVTLIDMGSDIATILTQVKPDIIFNCLHGTFGEDGSLPGILNILKIPYTHSGVLSSSLCFNKKFSKIFFNAHNIKSPNFKIIKKSDNILVDPMKRPYVIKPLNQGSSIGIEVIFEEDNFNFKNYNFPYGDEVIIEEYIKGREINVAVLNGKSLGTLEIIPLKNRFYDYETKYTEGLAHHICPANLSQKITDEVMSMSEKLFKIMQCNGIIRVEFLFDDIKNELFLLEINTHPGMTSMSLCPEIAASCGINYEQLIENILFSARLDK